MEIQIIGSTNLSFFEYKKLILPLLNKNKVLILEGNQNQIKFKFKKYVSYIHFELNNDDILHNYLYKLENKKFSIILVANDSMPTKFVEFLKDAAMIYSATERKFITSLNPGLQKVSSMYPDVKQEYILLIREHILLEKFNLVSALVNKKISAKNIYFFPKEDRGPNYNQIIRNMRQLGINVYQTSTREGIFPIVEQILRNKPIEKVIVVDDGGDLIKAASLICNNKKISAIETTTKGYKYIRNLKNLNLINISNSSVKLNVSQQIGLSCVSRFRALFGDRILSNRRILVIGYGNLGKAIADKLISINMVPIITDKDAKQLRLAEENRMPIIPYKMNSASLKTLKEINFIFCSTGVPVLNRETIELFGDNIVIASASSQDCKELIDELRSDISYKLLMSKRGFLFKNTITNKLILIAAFGHAINLFHSEGVNEVEFDAFTVQMFEKILLLADTRRNC
ncbi:hypothetical protein [Listeria booriae]|uniref:hypothetical protein n=1 Tax=Listeria booriae TaxID=1552123 RepID=UPI0016299FA9|nr:hypothetical protein [Listeria booriae]MBC1513574.1 hypothetical protein [Listeria booriae]MBC6152553.1 hypothetical protein [Listeria booriae]MBC6306850.1 hypothetical protein [Listeria booriae]